MAHDLGSVSAVKEFLASLRPAEIVAFTLRNGTVFHLFEREEPHAFRAWCGAAFPRDQVHETTPELPHKGETCVRCHFEHGRAGGKRRHGGT